MISVVMTTYNGEKYVIEQLLSLQKQTVKIDEVLISDDCSTDTTVEIVEKFISDNQLENWHIIRNAKNIGWRKNFINTALKAQGDLIFFCDQDDIWMSHKVEVMSDAMKNAGIDVLAGKYVKFQDQIPEITDIKNQGFHKVKEDNHLLYTNLPGCVYCVRKEFFHKIVRHWNGVFSHDAICWAVAKLLGTAYVLEMPVIFWRRHPDSTYTIASREVKKRENRIEWLEKSQKNIDCIKLIMEDLTISDAAKRKVYRYENFNRLRIDMLQNRRLRNAVKLIKYLDCYNKKKQFLLELFLVIR